MDAEFHILSVKDSNSRTRLYRRRKPHTKDHLGCQTCKQRRIKCDKTRPFCTRCVRALRNCEYDGAALEAPTPMTNRVSTQFWSATIAESILEPHMQAVGITDRRSATSLSVLLSHLTGGLGGFVFLTTVPLDPCLWHLCCQHHHLLAALLAVSASHLSYYAPDAAMHCIAHFGLSSVAFSLFRSAVQEQPVSQPESDALLLTAMMLNTLAFANVDDELDIQQSWVFSEGEDRLGWLALQIGLKPLLLATRPFRSDSLLLPIFAASHLSDMAGQDDDEHEYTSMRESLLDESLLGEFEESLHEPVRVLSKLQRLCPSGANLLRYVQFIGTLDSEFLQLLYHRDERTLWIFGCWLGLIGRVPGMWWSSKRVRRDREAIWHFLEEKGMESGKGRKSTMWRDLMEEYCVE